MGSAVCALCLVSQTRKLNIERLDSGESGGILHPAEGKEYSCLV